MNGAVILGLTAGLGGAVSGARVAPAPRRALPFLLSPSLGMISSKGGWWQVLTGSKRAGAGVDGGRRWVGMRAPPAACIFFFLAFFLLPL